METLAIVLAILFVGLLLDLRDDPYPSSTLLLLTEGLFGGALASAIYVAVTG